MSAISLIAQKEIKKVQMWHTSCPQASKCSLSLDAVLRSKGQGHWASKCGYKMRHNTNFVHNLTQQRWLQSQS